jgi:hypothetical protein
MCPNHSLDDMEIVVESRSCRGHNLSSGCQNHAKFIPLERYFDEEDDGIGFKGLKVATFSQKLKYQSTSFLMGLRDNSTSRAHILRSRRRIWENLYRWKDKMMKITYEVISMAKKFYYHFHKIKTQSSSFKREIN